MNTEGHAVTRVTHDGHDGRNHHGIHNREGQGFHSDDVIDSHAAYHQNICLSHFLSIFLHVSSAHTGLLGVFRTVLVCVSGCIR